MEHYWLAICNEDTEVTGIMRSTKEEAVEDCQNAFEMELAERGADPGLQYYVEEQRFIDGEVTVLKREPVEVQAKTEPQTIREICEKYGFTQTALAKRFSIPLRTVQDWHGERRKPLDYVVRMMVEILERDN